MSVAAPIVEELTPPPTVEQALTACSDLPGLILFDSARRGSPLGRHSFLAADPIAWDELATPRWGIDPFQTARGWLAALPAEPRPELPPFQGGVAGLLGYELGQCWERLPIAPHDELALPALAVGLYDWTVAWDHAQGRAWLISQGWPERSARGRLRRARSRAALIRTRLSTRIGASFRSRPAAETPAALTAPTHPLPLIDGLVSNFTHDGYLAAVARVIEYIRAGDIFQANLSQRLLCPASCSPVELYLRLRGCNPAPFAAYFAHDDWAVLSASPERFLQVAGREVSTRPIKGTRQRRLQPEADLYQQDELLDSAKDIAENVMIVDLLRNDLSRVCRPGSIRVPQLCGVESYQTVHHLVSEVRGELESGCDPFDLLAATFPGGSITGCPKVRAMEIITELEQTARGPYCGSLFYLGPDGRMDSSILIRTITHRRGWLHLPAGGGVVAPSVPADEYAETLHKAAGLLAALR